LADPTVENARPVLAGVRLERRLPVTGQVVDSTEPRRQSFQLGRFSILSNCRAGMNRPRPRLPGTYVFERSIRSPGLIVTRLKVQEILHEHPRSYLIRSSVHTGVLGDHDDTGAPLRYS